MESSNLSKNVKPLLRQFMVCLGVSLSFMEHSLVIGYTTVILPQLRQHPTIIIDDSAASWIASIAPITSILGFLIILILINRCGRRYANLISALFMVVGWTCLALATNVATILIGRFIQGVGMGFSSLSTALLVGEYTTPKYRGAFLTMMSFTLLLGGLLIHIVGSCTSWNNTAFFCLGIAVTDSILVLCSPESPVFLANCEKFEECKRVFRWLRGFGEDDELNAMIKKKTLTKISKTRNTQVKVKDKILKTFILTLKKSEFYKPLIVMIHLVICNAWCGAIMMDAYGADIFQVLIGKDVNITFMLLSMDVLRIISSLVATVFNTKIKRRLMIKVFFNLNILAYFISAAYYYAKMKNFLPFDHKFIGAALIYFLTFTVGIGTVPMVCIISGEIFPLKYKNVCTAITTLFMAMSVGLQLKTLPYLFSTVGLHGTYCIYGTILAYGTIVTLIMLPETKDLTLQNIEEVHWKLPKIKELTDEKLEELDLVLQEGKNGEKP